MYGNLAKASEKLGQTPAHHFSLLLHLICFHASASQVQAYLTQTRAQVMKWALECSQSMPGNMCTSRSVGFIAPRFLMRGAAVPLKEHPDLEVF